MVFPGRFSSGCLRCRQRKVKCDEGKPTCKRCYNYGRPCPGYTDEFHFRYNFQKSRSQSISSSTISTKKKTSSVKRENRDSAPAETKPTATKSPSTKRDQQDKTSQSPCQPVVVAPDQSRSIALVRHPSQSYDNVSLCYFIRRFVSPDEGDGFPGHFSFLPSLYDHYRDGLLETATLSVAQLAAYNHLGGEELRTQSLRNYGRAIKGLQESIQSHDQAIDDRVIATVLLLCTYKDFSGEGLGDPNEHACGLFYLLEKRGPGQIATRRGAELFLLALLRLQIYSFLHGDDTYTDPGAIATIMGIFNPLLRALSMMSRTLSLRHRLCGFIQLQEQQADSPSSASQSSVSSEDEQVLIKECFEMLDNFHEWDQEAALYWQSTFEGRGVPTTLGEMGSGNRHYDAETACIIILVRSARLILLLTMLLYQSTLQPEQSTEDGDYGNMWAECVPVLVSDIQKSIEDMLASVPYALGDIDPNGMPATMVHDGAAAIIIVHSIRLVTHCAYATQSQIERAEIILTRMNSAIGIRSAVGWIAGETYGVSLPSLITSPRLLECSSEGECFVPLNEVGLGSF